MVRLKGEILMGRQNYMTITVSDTVQDIFNEFVSREGDHQDLSTK